MNPDEAHTLYFKENPNGNHMEPSPITREFMDEQKKVNVRMLDSLQKLEVNSAINTEKIGQVHAWMAEHKTEKEEFVQKTEFEPVKNVVYGLVTICLLAIIGAVLRIVIR